jgi:hypothetical protein
MKMLKGQAANASLATTIVVISVSLIIGLFVFSTIDNSIDKSPLSAAANASITNVVNNTFSGFNLAAIVVIVVAAAAILLVLRLFR